MFGLRSRCPHRRLRRSRAWGDRHSRRRRIGARQGRGGTRRRRRSCRPRRWFGFVDRWPLDRRTAAPVPEARADRSQCGEQPCPKRCPRRGARRRGDGGGFIGRGRLGFGCRRSRDRCRIKRWQRRVFSCGGWRRRGGVRRRNAARCCRRRCIAARRRGSGGRCGGRRSSRLRWRDSRRGCRLDWSRGGRGRRLPTAFIRSDRRQAIVRRALHAGRATFVGRRQAEIERARRRGRGSGRILRERGGRARQRHRERDQRQRRRIASLPLYPVCHSVSAIPYHSIGSARLNWR